MKSKHYITKPDTSLSKLRHYWIVFEHIPNAAIVVEPGDADAVQHTALLVAEELVVVVGHRIAEIASLLQIT